MLKKICLLLTLCLLLPQSAWPQGKVTRPEPVAIFWQEGEELKALTILVLAPDKNKAVIGTVPVFSYYAAGRGGPGSRGMPQTIEELYRHSGRAEVQQAVAEYLKLPVRKYITIEQKSFEQMSRLIGPAQLNGKKITMAAAFEQTRLSIRHDDQEVVRAFSAKLRQPEEWWKLPRLALLLIEGVDTNLTMAELWQYYSVYRQIGPEQTYKEAIQGQDFYIAGVKYRAISPGKWQEFFPRLLK